MSKNFTLKNGSTILQSPIIAEKHKFEFGGCFPEAFFTGDLLNKNVSVLECYNFDFTYDSHEIVGKLAKSRWIVVLMLLKDIKV